MAENKKQNNICQVFPAFNVFLSNIYFPRCWIGNAGAGNIDIYTVPSGRQALVMVSPRVYNTSGSSINVYAQVKISGVYYRLSSTVSVASGALSSLTMTLPFILNAGEIFGINTSASGINCGFGIMEFDTNSKIVRGQKLGFSSNNTLYTCPAGKNAFEIRKTITYGDFYALFSNGAASSTTITVYNVPSGGSAGNSNEVTSSSISSNSVNTSMYVGCSLTAGDSIQFTSSVTSSASSAFVNLIEV